MKISERKLKQLLHILQPELYNLAVQKTPVWLTLYNNTNTSDKPICKGKFLSTPQIVIFNNYIRIIFEPKPTWKIINKAYSIKVGVSKISENKPFVFIGHHNMTIYKLDEITISELFVQIGDERSQ